MVVIERLEPNSFGADWLVEGERTLDSNGAHSWFLCRPAFRRMRLGSRAPFTGSNLFVFDGPRSGRARWRRPEASTWVMMLIGFAGRSVAGYRSSGDQRFLNPHAQEAPI
jgi:hypothetical protein